MSQLEEEQIARERQLMLDRRNPKVDRRLDKIAQEVTAELKQTETSQNPTTNEIKSAITGTAIQLRDGEIREVFLNTLESANQMILIFSPWVNKDVLDNQFIQELKKLAQRGVWILLGYGIARNESEEERPLADEVKKKLAQVKTVEGLSAVQIVWLGNSHAKEVVVDRRIHLSGSHNWLSYRGDRLPRGETVYKVTIPEEVDKAYRHLASRFQEPAKSLWKQAVSKRDASLATTSLCIWGALAMGETGLQEIEKKQWLDLLPVWLKVTCQGLRSRQLSPESSCFPRSLSLLSQLDPSFSQIKVLRKGWQKAIALIANCDRQIALKLLSEPVWNDFIRLGIVTETNISPETFISGELAKLSQNLSQNKNKTVKKPKQQKSD